MLQILIDKSCQHVVGTHWKCLIETLPMSTHICFEEVTKEAVMKTVSMSIYITANVFVKSFCKEKRSFMGKNPSYQGAMR